MRKSRANVEEEEFLASYRPSNYPRPAVTVDIVVLTIVDAVLKVLLVKRNEHPFKGRWALPGGFVRLGEKGAGEKGVGDKADHRGESLDEAAARELAEETGLPKGAAFLEQLRAFGAADRDPRMRVISIAYWSLVRPTLVPLVRAGGDASHARWYSLEEARALALAFDHDEIIAYAVSRARSEIDISAIAFELVPETFSIPELRAVYEVVKGTPLDAGNFRKRVQRLLEGGILEVAPGKRITASKPAKVYRFKRN